MSSWLEGLVNTMANVGKNAASDVGNIATGLYNLPGEINNAASSPQNAWNFGKSVVKGTMDEANQFLGNPIKNQPLIGIQTPEQNINQAASQLNHAYQHPVNTALDLATAIGVGARNPVVAESDLPPTEASVAKNAGNRFIRGQYNLSPKSSESFTPGDVDALANYGLTKPADVANAADKITGANGIGTKLVRSAVKQSQPIPLGELKDSTGNYVPGVIDNAKNLLDQGEFIPETTAQKAFQFIKNVVFKNQGNNILDGDPIQMYDAMKGLENKAAGLTNPDIGVQQLKRVYLGVADDIENRIFNVSGANQNLNNMSLSPEDFQTLNNVSPKLAGDVQSTLQNGTVGDLRSIQAPFVRGARAAAESVARTGNTPISMRTVLETYIAAHNPLGIGLVLADTGWGKRLIGNTLRNADNIGGAVSKVAKPLPIAAGEAGIQANSPEIVNKFGNHNQNSNTPENESDHNASILQTGSKVNTITQGTDTTGNFSVNNIPQNMNDVKLNPDGTVIPPLATQIVDSTGQKIAIDPNDANKQITALNAANAKLRPKAANTISDPTGAQEAQGQIDQNNDQLASLKNLASSSTTLIQASTTVRKITGKVNSALQTLNTTSPNLANLNGQIDDVMNNLAPEYSSLKQQLAAIKSEIGGNNLDVKTKASLQSVLETINRQNVYDYFTAVGGFGVNGASTPSNPMAPTAQGVPAFPPVQSAPPPPVQNTHMNWQGNAPQVNSILQAGGY